MSEVIVDFRAHTASKNVITPKVAADLVVVAEFFIVFLSAFLAKYAYLSGYLGQSEPFEKYFFHAVAASTLICHLAYRRGLYEPKALGAPLRTAFPILSVIAISFAVMVLVGYVFKFAQLYSRGWMFTWFTITVTVLIAERLLILRLFLWFTANGYFRRRIAVLGSVESASELVNAMREKEAHVELAGLFGADEHADAGSSRYSAALAAMVNLGQQNRFDEIFIVPDKHLEQGDLAKIISKLRILPVVIKLCPMSLGRGFYVRDFESISGITALSVQTKPISGWGGIQKMMLDYIVSVAALVLLAPMFAAIAIAIKWDSPGTVFFRQRRHGFNHAVFSVWKFRTMTVIEDGDTVVQAKREDARVTRVGKFLRRTSLDELPQLINVVLGEMSLVGPRPHAVAHNNQYAELFDTYGNRHLVKPGITGWAQINGLRGPTENPELMRKRLAYDQFYIENWSLSLDIKILLAT
ncbi:MAG: undecaprenyl-phosphate glucose phosphotransferase, partial [Hyphomicrobiaceae bacterium]|nr:undecaprenyl-phosphate glucose phosphotransferase [Hyphomicrobiaceae bacterium]